MLLLAATVLLVLEVASAGDSRRRCCPRTAIAPYCARCACCAQMGLLLWMNMAPSLALVVDWLDESTLGLLFGMMIIVGRLKDTVRLLLPAGAEA